MQRIVGEPPVLRSLERVAYFYWKIGHPYGLMLREEYERWIGRLIDAGALKTKLNAYRDRVEGSLDWTQEPSIGPHDSALVRLPENADWKRVGLYVSKHIGREARDRIVLQHGFLRNIASGGSGRGNFRVDRLYLKRPDAREITGAHDAMLDYELVKAGDSVIGIDSARIMKEAKEETG